jgi:hypothetical protein
VVLHSIGAVRRRGRMEMLRIVGCMGKIIRCGILGPSCVGMRRRCEIDC